MNLTRTRLSKALLILLILLASIGYDQATKHLARTRLMSGGTKSAEYESTRSGNTPYGGTKSAEYGSTRSGNTPYGGTKSAEYGGTVFVVDNILALRYVENEGGFLSLGSRLPRAVRTVTFVAFPLLILFWIVISLARNRETGWAVIVGFSFVAGGGLGNLIDRLFRDGRVSDFIIMGVGRLRTGVFNLADVSVLIGCLLLLVSPLISPRKT